MRKLTVSFAALILAVTLVPSALGQACNWSGVTETCGNAGIGTSIPSTILDVKAAANKHLGVRQASDFGGLSTAIALHAYNDGLSAAIPFSIESTLLTLNAATHGTVGIGTTTPGLLLDVKSTGVGWPATGGSTQTGIFRLSQGAGTGVLDFGIAGTTQLGAWLQATASDSLGARYDILLNPLGGRVGIAIQGNAKAQLSLPNGVGAAGQIGLLGNAGSSSNRPGLYFGSNGSFSGTGASAYFGITAAPAGHESDFALVGSSDSSTHRNLLIGYNTSDDPSLTFNPKVTIDTFNGNITTTGTITGAVYQDLAEWVPATETLSAGTVVVLNPVKSNEVTPSSTAYDTTVAGVVSEHPGIVLGKSGADRAQIATTGRVKVKVDARTTPIKIGDLLVTSDVAGTAMKSEPVEINGRRFHQPGTIVGKALEPLQSGTGEILVLLSLQ